MKSITLQAFTDESTGSLGLGVRGMSRSYETNAALDGATIAHDLLEHVNGVQHIGSIDDELEALGALWFTRGQFNDLRRDGRVSYHSVYENVAADVCRMFRDHVEGGAYVAPDAPRTRACDADDEFNDVLECADRGWRGEFYDPSEGAHAWPAYRAVCLSRLRIGFRKARRKYKDARDANSLFWAVANAVDRYAHNVEFEGAEYKLIYGFHRDGRTFAHCEEAYPEE